MFGVNRLFMTNNILGCYITGLYMTFNQWQFLLSTSPFCCVRHASLQSCLARNQQAMAWQHMDGHRVAVSCHTSCSLSQVHQTLLPTTINLIHSLSSGQCVVGVLLAGHFSVRYTPLVYRRWWSIPYYYGKAAQTSPFPATMKWGSYSDTVRCHSSGVW